MPRYIIVEQEKRWRIVNPQDTDLIWHGSHWGYCGQKGTPLISFPNRDAAEHYASTILGGAEE